MITPYENNQRDPLITVLMSMAGERYPGKLGGGEREALGAWLDGQASDQRWVAVDAGEVCGHVQIGPVHRDEFDGLESPLPAGTLFEVARLFVAPQKRGSALGALLLEHALREAGNQGGAAAILRVSDYLDHAVALYRRTGWSDLGSVTSRLDGDLLLVLTYQL